MRNRPSGADTNCMADHTSPTDTDTVRLRRAVRPELGRTELLVRETWKNYYCARLAEAQFGPESLEASLAHSRALDSYRELRGSLREIDPYYRPPARHDAATALRGRRHLKLVRDDPAEQEIRLEP